MHYRRDIDGLRASAVLAVVDSHAGLTGLRGGFIGVDVFFVISGYLIAGLIRERQAAGTWSLSQFYERRARRILPALFAMLATVSLLAAAVARLPTALAAAGPPFYFGVVDLLILTAVLYDIVTRRKVHPVYVWGGLAILASQVIRLALSGTSAWLTVAAWLTSG